MDLLVLVYMKLLLLKIVLNEVDKDNNKDKVHFDLCLCNLQELVGNKK